MEDEFVSLALGVDRVVTRGFRHRTVFHFFKELRRSQRLAFLISLYLAVILNFMLFPCPACKAKSTNRSARRNRWEVSALKEWLSDMDSNHVLGCSHRYPRFLLVELSFPTNILKKSINSGVCVQYWVLPRKKLCAKHAAVQNLCKQ